MKTWIISDTHFNHKNIIRYCDRPFKDVNHMNEVLINNWNEVVAPDDFVYHVGDFAFGDITKQRPIFNRLLGRKILIRGNHDKSKSAMLSVGFEQVHDRLTLVVGEKRVALYHWPDKGIPPNHDILIHGHTHENKVMTAPGMFCACVEAIGYRPAPLEEFITIVAEIEGKWLTKNEE